MRAALLRYGTLLARTWRGEMPFVRFLLGIYLPYLGAFAIALLAMEQTTGGAWAMQPGYTLPYYGLHGLLGLIMAFMAWRNAFNGVKPHAAWLIRAFCLLLLYNSLRDLAWAIPQTPPAR